MSQVNLETCVPAFRKPRCAVSHPGGSSDTARCCQSNGETTDPTFDRASHLLADRNTNGTGASRGADGDGCRRRCMVVEECRTEFVEPEKIPPRLNAHRKCDLKRSDALPSVL